MEGEALGHHRRLPQPTRHRAPRPSRPRVFFPRRGRARLVPAGQPALLQLGQRAPLPCRRVVESRKQPRPPLPDLPGAVEVLCRRERGVDTAEPAAAAAEARRFRPVAEPGSPAQLDAAALRRSAAQGQALQQVVRVRAALRRSKARRSEAKAQSGRIHKVGLQSYDRCGKRTYLSVLVRDAAAGQPPARAVPHQQVARSAAGIVHELSIKYVQKRPKERQTIWSDCRLTSSRVVTIASAAGASGWWCGSRLP